MQLKRGGRYLVKIGTKFMGYSAALQEITVLEVSPSGGRVKIKQAAITQWVETSEVTVVEELRATPKLSISFESLLSNAGKDAYRVWRDRQWRP